MADGGIVVSGGATGHGTLISTNLLYAPLLLNSSRVPLARPAFTLGGTAGATGFEAAYAVDRDAATLFKTGAAGTDLQITIDLGSGNTNLVHGVVLLGHNLTATNIDDAADSYAGAWLEGGTTTGYSDVSQALTLNADTLSPAFHLLATPQSYRYWRVRVNFNSSLALQIGEIFLIGAAPLAFTKNYNKDFDKDYEIGKVQSSGICGINRVYSRWERVRLDMNFRTIPVAQLTAMQVAARNGHVVFSPEGANSFAYFGIFELERPKYVGNDRWNVVAHFTESAI